MIPVEVVMFVLWIICGMVGLSRRFPRELGATIGFTAMLLMLTLLGDRVGGLLFKLAAVGSVKPDEALVKWFVYTFIISTWVLFMYAGETLSFAGTWPPDRVLGILIDLVMGLLNGWIVVGTWWYYTAKLDYPIQKLGWFVGQPSALAARLVTMTPIALLPDGYETRILAIAVVGLIALRVFR